SWKCLTRVWSKMFWKDLQDNRDNAQSYLPYAKEDCLYARRDGDDTARHPSGDYIPPFCQRLPAPSRICAWFLFRPRSQYSFLIFSARHFARQYTALADWCYTRRKGKEAIDILEISGPRLPVSCRRRIWWHP